jgi:DNA-binding CsgD family transcriptional regulator
VLEGKRYETQGYLQSAWRQSAPIRIANRIVGEVSVCYRTEQAAAFEGPFLREERTLINAVAEYLGTIGRRISAERELQETNRLLTIEREALKETNTALRTVLAKIDEEKREVSRDIHANVEKILLPILHALALELPPAKRAYADLLQRNLLDLTAPFTHRLTTAFTMLTPVEVAICDMIRGGIRTKEIARLRGISPATVNRHREHIRRKLGLANRKANLTTYLQSRAFESASESDRPPASASG